MSKSHIVFSTRVWDIAQRAPGLSHKQQLEAEMTLNLDQVLPDFYVQYLAWHAAGAVQKYPFDRAGGLCSNFSRFLHRHYATLGAYFRDDQRRRLTKQFVDAGLDHRYPFNPDGEEGYDREHDAGLAHLNPRRYAWVAAAVQKGFIRAAD